MKNRCALTFSRSYICNKSMFLVALYGYLLCFIMWYLKCIVFYSTMLTKQINWHVVGYVCKGTAMFVLYVFAWSITAVTKENWSIENKYAYIVSGVSAHNRCCLSLVYNYDFLRHTNWLHLLKCFHNRLLFHFNFIYLF